MEQNSLIFFPHYRQQGFSVLSLALTSQALNLVTSLFEDAGVEMHDSTTITAAKLDILVNSTALQRVAKIFEVGDGLIHFFFCLTPIIYRKVRYFEITFGLNLMAMLSEEFRFVGVLVETCS